MKGEHRLSTPACQISTMLSSLVLSAFVFASLCRGAPSASPIPSYVLQYAPISYLYSDESWWPADVANHLTHVVPKVDQDVIASSVDFNSIGSLPIDSYLSSRDDIESQPSWMFGVQPDSSGYTSAPATIIVVNKPGGIIDAFYFYFYSYDHATVCPMFFTSPTFWG